MPDSLVVYAKFVPKKVDSLKPGALQFIGMTMEFEPGWLITEEDSETYAGQQAWCFRDKSVPFLWAPEEDLEFVNHE